MKIGSDAAKVQFEAEQPFCFNASVYTQEELSTRKHRDELEKSGYSVICIDYK